MTRMTGQDQEEDRPRALLAPVDRAYLRGDKEYSHRQTAYDREQTIRTRVRNGLFDLQLVLDEMSDEELEKTFGEYADDPELWRALRDVVTLVFRVTALQGMVDTIGGYKLNEHFERLVEEAVRSGYLLEDSTLDEFEMTHRTTHIPSLMDMITDAEEEVEISPELIRLVLEDEAIESEPIQEAVREQLLEFSDHEDGPPDDPEQPE